jgi:hypothetical protein
LHVTQKLKTITPLSRVSRKTHNQRHVSPLIYRAAVTVAADGVGGGAVAGAVGEVAVTMLAIGAGGPDA